VASCFETPAFAALRRAPQREAGRHFAVTPEKTCKEVANAGSGLFRRGDLVYVRHALLG